MKPESSLVQRNAAYVNEAGSIRLDGCRQLVIFSRRESPLQVIRRFELDCASGEIGSPSLYERCR